MWIDLSFFVKWHRSYIFKKCFNILQNDFLTILVDGQAERHITTTREEWVGSFDMDLMPKVGFQALFFRKHLLPMWAATLNHMFRLKLTTLVWSFFFEMTGNYITYSFYTRIQFEAKVVLRSEWLSLAPKMAAMLVYRSKVFSLLSNHVWLSFYSLSYIPTIRES